MKAVILAAGKGLRMKPLTKTIPKPLIKLKGKSFLERQLTELKKAGITEVIIVIGFLGEKIQKEFNAKQTKEKKGISFGEFKGIKLFFVLQEKQKGTADGINCAKKLISDDFIQVNGDLIFESELISELMNKKENVLVLRETDNAENFGLAEIKGNKVKKIIEKPKENEKKEIKSGKECKKQTSEKKLVNSGIYRFTSEIFDAIKKIKLSERGELELTDAINILAEQNKVEWIKVKGKFFDVGTIKDLKKAEKEIK